MDGVVKESGAKIFAYSGETVGIDRLTERCHTDESCHFTSVWINRVQERLLL